jgi:threonine dehydrogenase-like Zn-dependent dehydrogenase
MVIVASGKITEKSVVPRTPVGYLRNASLGNIHVAGSFCAPSATCFATTTEVSTVPETGSLSLVGTGLIGLAALVRRRFAT